MLFKRTYRPTDEEIIYHYCDARAFHAICTQRKIWLSDIYTMNDYFELRWGYSVWESAVTELLAEFGKEYLDKIDEIIHHSGTFGSILSTSFSTKGDVLNQWRAYANDGKGFAIGFLAKDIFEMPVRWLKILYNRRQQIEEFKEAIRSIHDFLKTFEDKNDDTFIAEHLRLAIDLAAFKNTAFEEEDEIRAIHVLNFEPSNKSLRLFDAGGISFGNIVPGHPVSFRMRESVPVSYIEVDFTYGGKLNPIKEVILGPKNNAIISGISVFLETIGIGSVQIKRSNASYR